MIPRTSRACDQTDQPLLGRGPVVQFEGHIIRFLRCEFLPMANSIGAFVVIEPPTTLPAPDVVLGLGTQEDQARSDAFARAHAKIKNSVEARGGGRLG